MPHNTPLATHAHAVAGDGQAPHIPMGMHAVAHGPPTMLCGNAFGTELLVCVSRLSYQGNTEMIALVPSYRQLRRYKSTLAKKDKGNDTMRTIGDLHEWGDQNSLESVLQKKALQQELSLSESLGGNRKLQKQLRDIAVSVVKELEAKGHKDPDYRNKNGHLEDNSPLDTPQQQAEQGDAHGSFFGCDLPEDVSEDAVDLLGEVDLEEEEEDADAMSAAATEVPPKHPSASNTQHPPSLLLCRTRMHWRSLGRKKKGSSRRCSAMTKCMTSSSPF